MRGDLGRTLAIGAAMLLAGCATSPKPEPPNVDFVRGCWKGEPAPLTLLRLLPDRDDPAWLAGVLSNPDGSAATLYRFSRDGQSVATRRADSEQTWRMFVLTKVAAWLEAPEKGSLPTRVVFFNKAEHEWLIVEGGNDLLRLSVTTGPGIDYIAYVVLFAGGRDGCD